MCSRQDHGSVRVALMVGLTAALLGALALPATAADRKHAKPQYAIKVLAIRATRSNRNVSRELKLLAKELEKQTGYTGFKLEKTGGGAVVQGKPQTVALVSGYSTRITPLSRDKGRIKLKIEIFRREGKKDVRKITTTVTTKRSRYSLQSLPYGGGSADRLIIAVAAR